MAEHRRSGKLAVILHADVVGSTALVQQDEQLAHERIQGTFRRFGDTITKYHGSVRELRGDALLAEFERASDAITAALAFQAEQRDYLAQLKDSIQPKVRVGIAMGEVVIADETITGAGVVLAQRLEQLSEPGGVVIQGAAYETIPGRFPFEFANLGENEVKGFEEPVRVYSASLKRGSDIPQPVPLVRRTHNTRIAFTSVVIVITGIALMWFKPWEVREEPASVERMAFPLPDKPSIAVLPFTNMSGDAEQEYFVDGMTEDLITDLSKLSGLFVIARNSVFTYKDKAVKVGQVAEELGVRYVLEGSVRRAGDQVRVNAQLTDATTGGHLWAERYDGTLENVFALQDKVTREIIAALAVNLSGEEQASQAQSETNSPQAYDAFLQGWEHYRRGTPDGLKKSIAYLEQATERDPLYSRAYAALAAVYWRIYSNLWYEQVQGVGYSFQAVEQAREYLKEALKSPTPLAYQVAAEIGAHATDMYLYQPIVIAKSAITLDPNDPTGHLAMAMALLKADKAGEAEHRVREAMRLDPHYPTHYLVLLASTEFAMGRYPDAAATLERAVDRDATNHRTYIYLVATYGHLGRQADAKIALDKANELRAKAGWSAYSLSSVDELLWVGDATHFKEGLRRAGVAPGGDDWSRLIKTVSTRETASASGYGLVMTQRSGTVGLSTGETAGASKYEVEGATTIDAEQAMTLHDRNVPFIDVSKPWLKEHIPGAQFLMIWFGKDSEFNEVRLARIAQRNQPLVIYSSGLERRAANACAQAVSWGFEHVYYFANGLKKWKAAGNTVAAGY
ncbi:MAG: rhodanese-like domain-containing protein [Gammaproteobacteria bacterium]|nr:rhodanese-like domain-containing protein [Gammaproteobacteria bacterium]